MSGAARCYTKVFALERRRPSDVAAIIEQFLPDWATLTTKNHAG